MLRKNWILLLFSIGLLVIVFFLFKSVLSYIIISGVITLITRPIFKKLIGLKVGKIKLGKSISALLTLLAFYTIGAILIMIFIPSIVKEASVITSIDTEEAFNAIKEPLQNLEASLNQYTDQPFSVQNYVKEKTASLINITAISGWINSLTAFTGNLFVSFFAITFITFFFLRDATLILKNIYAIIPFRLRDETDSVLTQVKYKLTRYFIGICIEVLLVFTFNSIGLWSIGIKNFFIIAFFAGIINVIPYIGPLFGIIFGIIIVITTNYTLDWSTELLPLIGYCSLVMIITQLLDNFIFQPLIYSNSVNAHPLEIFLVILIAGNIYGIVGMMVAIPLYSVGRVIIKEFRQNSKMLDEIYSEN